MRPQHGAATPASRRSLMPRPRRHHTLLKAAAACAALAGTILLLPQHASAQIGATDDGELYAEAFGRTGYNSFSVHQGLNQQPHQQPLASQYQTPGGGGAPKTLKLNPAFFPEGVAGTENADVKRDKPGPFMVKLEKGKQLRYGGAGGVGRDEKQAMELFLEVAYAPAASGPEKMMALYEAALLYTTGAGDAVKQDLPAAVKALSEVLQFAEAKHTLAFYLATGFGGKPADVEAAFKFETAAADGGSNGAILAMGYQHLYGLGGVEADCGKALELYKAVATIAVQEYEAVPYLALKRGEDEIALIEARKKAAQGEGGGSDDEIRRKWLAAAAAKDAPADALYEVAKMYDTGSYGMTPSPQKAVEFYQAAAAKGHAGAMGDLGIMYALGSEAQEGPHGLPVRGMGLPQDLDLAVDLLERAAELGDAPALNALAYLYQEGKGVDQDSGKAQILFKQAALKDHPEALFHYGEHLLETGDLPSAMAAFHRSGELGFIYGAYKEGMLYLEGVDPEFIPQSCPAAAEAFKRAAEGGYWAAVARYGLDLYKRGDLVGAVAVLSMAAEEGYELAQANAAYLLANRMGYSHDDADDLALRLYARAAMQSEEHYFALGELMLKMERAGLDTTDGASGPVLGVAQALSYIETAAEAGSVQALRRLAEMHEQGEAGVVRRDGRKALKYYRALLEALSAQEEEGESAGSSSGWGAFTDKAKINMKITALALKEGVSKFMGGSGEDGEGGEEEGVRGLDDIKVKVVRKADGFMGR